MSRRTTPELKRTCVLAFALVLVLTACGATQHASAQSSRTQRAAASTDPTSQPTRFVPVQVQSSDPKSRAHRRPCRSSNLKLAVSSDGAGGGTNFGLIHLRNTGRRTCSLFGYPGVSFLDADRHQLGRAAVRDQGLPGVRIKVRRFSLKPGAVGSALLLLSDDSRNNCPDAPVASFVRVFPPGQRVALIARQRIFVCVPRIDSMTPGKSGK